MKLLITSVRRRAALALVAAAVVVGGTVGAPGTPPASAEPSSLKLKYKCKYPQIGTKDLTVTISLDYPKRVASGGYLPVAYAKTVATVNADTTDGLLAVRAASLEGDGRAGAFLDLPDQDLEAQQRFGIPHTKIPPVGAFDLKVAVRVPSLDAKQEGPGKILIRDLDLRNLKPRKADGTPTSLGESISVPCTQVPGQDNVLAAFEVVKGPDTKAPSRPGTPQVTAKSAKSVTLAWGRSTDDNWVSGYDVYKDGVLVPNPAKVSPSDPDSPTSVGTGNSVTIPGLTPATRHSFTVRARDLAGNASEASAPVEVTTDADVPDTVPPTAPGKPVLTGLAKDTVVMSWTESTDNVGVTGYNIYADDKLVSTADTTFGWAGGLTPERDYVFTVRAKDAAGNLSPASPPLPLRTPKGPPKECGELKGEPEWIDACAYMAGYSNVNKLDAAVVLNDPKQDPVLTNVTYYATEKTAKAKFKFVGPLRTRSTLLTFGFMPTTATMELTQLGVGVLEGEDTADGFKGNATARMSVRLLDATVKGTPLELGQKCRTSKPMTIDLKTDPDYRNVKDGGPLSGTMAIPAFAGCGVGEDLDRLLNGAISGGDNLIRIIQGPVCQTSHATCTPVDPVGAR